MCRIAGIVGPNTNATTVARMTGIQRHRGPDGDGFYAAPGVTLWRRRLEIIDLSEAGRQPMSTPDGRYTIVYNGEVYNSGSVKGHSAARGLQTSSRFAEDGFKALGSDAAAGVVPERTEELGP